jgi:hypothetical protein
MTRYWVTYLNGRKEVVLLSHVGVRAAMALGYIVTPV